MRYLFAYFLLFSLFCFSQNGKHKQDLVKWNKWFIAGPVKENEETINSIRVEKGIISVTAKDNPKGEI